MRRSLLFLAALAVGIAGTASAWDDDATADGDSEVVASALEGVPGASFDDWASYSDAVVVATITAESERPLNEAEQRRGEGMVMRDLTARVDDVLWQHPNAPSLPTASFDFVNAGWIKKDGVNYPMRYENAVRMEVGTTYVMPIAFRRTTSSWAPLVPSSVRLLDSGGALSPPDTAMTMDTAPAPVEGMRPADIAAAMETATPDPVAEQNRHLDPLDRHMAVLQAGG